MEKESKICTLNAIRILQILWEHSDENHRLTQQEIIRKLHSEYGIDLKRKAVRNNLDCLKDMFEIESHRNGDKKYLPLKIEGKEHERVYLHRPFKDSELRLIIDSVLASRHISKEHTQDLVGRLCKLSSRHFKSNVKHIYSSNDDLKTDNKELFFNIEMIMKAINTRKQISFEYNNYDENGRLYRKSSHIVSPYHILLKNQHYFLMAFNEKKKERTNYRLDKITDIKILEDDATPLNKDCSKKNDSQDQKMVENYPYMFTDEPERIEFIADGEMSGEIFDWFGKTARISKQADGKYKVSVYTSPSAMQHWALQYIPSVEIISPENLRQKVIEEIKKAVKMYNM